MADLDDSYALWQAGIYQLEQADPVLGGAPNEATGAGMDNIPHLQLARRTKFLKDVVDAAGVGATAAPLVVLNTARKSGTYRFDSTDANTPATGVAGTVVVAAAAADAVNQLAFQSGGTRMWTRFWNGLTWSAWSELWQMSGTVANLTTTPYQRLPSGLIVQMGNAAQNIAAGALSSVITLPITFTAAPIAILATHAGSVESVNIIVDAPSITTSSFRFRSTYSGNQRIDFIALGK